MCRRSKGSHGIQFVVIRGAQHTLQPTAPSALGSGGDQVIR